MAKIFGTNKLLHTVDLTLTRSDIRSIYKKSHLKDSNII